MRNRHLQKRARTVRTLLKSLSANYRNGCPHITEKGVRELVKPALGRRNVDECDDEEHAWEVVSHAFGTLDNVKLSPKRLFNPAIWPVVSQAQTHLVSRSVSIHFCRPSTKQQSH